jgi:uncharacterized protein (TIGR02147 family)
MLSVFDYSDYRKYLSDFYALHKAKTPSFSYQVFAQRAGFRDKGFFHSVIHGSKNMSKSSIVKVSLALGHSSKEADFFENLVFLNQAKSLKEKNYYFERLNAMKRIGGRAHGILQLQREQYELCAVWYHGVIRSLIDMNPFRGDFDALAKQVFPPITQRQAKQSVELLEKLGLVRKDEGGVYYVNQRHLTTGNEIRSLAALNYHKSMTSLAERAITNLAADERNITGLTMGISRETFKKLSQEIRAFRARIVEIANNDPSADTVYQLNFHLFPLSKPRGAK